jgi:hypothetical protein
VLLENMVGFSFPIMAVDNIADIQPSLEILNRFLLDFVLLETGHVFEPQTEDFLHFCPLSRSIGRRVVRIPEIGFQNSRADED